MTHVLHNVGAARRGSLTFAALAHFLANNTVSYQQMAQTALLPMHLHVVINRSELSICSRPARYLPVSVNVRR